MDALLLKINLQSSLYFAIKNTSYNVYNFTQELCVVYRVKKFWQIIPY